MDIVNTLTKEHKKPSELSNPVAGLAFRLKKAGITSSRVNAEAILCEAIGCRIIDL